MAALPAGALPGAGAKPTGTHAQGGGLQPQTAGGHLGTAQRIANASLKKINERMKPKNLDDLDGHQSIFAAPRCRCVRSISKTTPFADISNSVTIPDSVTSFGNYAFGSCGNLTSVTIGSGVTSIVSGAFQQCSRLTNITVNASPDYSSLGGVLFDKAQVTLLQFPGGLGGSYTIPASVTSIGEEAFLFSGLTSVTIPGSVTSIPQSAFENCANLTSITIPDSVTSIGSQAFGGCGLTSVTIGTNVTSIGDQAFFYCSSLTGVYFQGNSPTPTNDTSVFSDDNLGVVYYLPGTTGWGALFDGLPTALWLPQVQTGNGSVGVKSNQFGFNISWAGSMVVVVEAATNLANPVWMPVSTNILTGGTSSFSDPQWTNYPGRYYRLRSP